jgi:uncharacterized protein YecT (DUF1311 family)
MPTRATFGVRTVCLALLAGALAAAQARAAGAPPAALQGAWEVTQVGVDENDQPHWRYEPDDPRLVGRALEVGAHGELSFDFGKSPCQAVDWMPRAPATLSALVGKTFPRPPGADLPRQPALNDFGLKLADRKVVAIDANCAAAKKAGDAPTRWNRAWFASLGADRMVLAYGGDLLLVLSRVDRAAAARASFSCAAAGTPTEKAICGSRALAGYDRSLAAAWQRGLHRHDDDKAAYEQAQRDWLATRNACGGDAACLSDRLQERLDVLMQD